MTYLFIAGLVAFIAGVALLSIPAALVVGGVTTSAVAFLYERGNS